MEPIPETVVAIEDFGPFAIEHVDLQAELLEMAHRVQQVVPECVGLSIGSSIDGVTFTVVASAAEIAALDAVQYLEGGPCVEGAKGEEALAYNHDELMNEQGWQLFARATHAQHVASTLTLPIMAGGRVVGTVNLYAATPDAFDNHHQAVADIFGAWASAAVSNADLSFATRTTAEQAPAILRDELDITKAWSILATREGIDIETARARLTEAARRAGASEGQLARILIELTADNDA
ncbi:GAF domain-containing protein [Nocardioides sp. cx-169]|uniref:GAF domain-containing protein n=1 Tax=Nocardioides sp. cx-169 TaxID=2899080 RepID=UPI001E572849|nr:GAF domain-containing protein [Nocardioides sp. cx-169]MCD4536138.1 GAF domain-containing protein [Nocardioides sp. cx-169]